LANLYQLIAVLAFHLSVCDQHSFKSIKIRAQVPADQTSDNKPYSQGQDPLINALVFDKEGTNTDKKAQEQAGCLFEHLLSGGAASLSNPSDSIDFASGYVLSS